jgi:hypothetical protein
MYGFNHLAGGRRWLIVVGYKQSFAEIKAPLSFNKK